MACENHRALITEEPMQKEKIFNDYLNQLVEKQKTNDAREESFYSTLEAFLMGYSKQLGRSVHITTLPKDTDAGNPDFRLWDESDRIIGYIEAKRPEEENLGRIEKMRRSFQKTPRRDRRCDCYLAEFWRGKRHCRRA